MKAYLILEDGTVFTGTSIGSQREVISEIVFNTSMTGYLEVLTDPSYAGQAVVMTYPLIGNYGICRQDMESLKPWPDGYIVREAMVTSEEVGEACKMYAKIHLDPGCEVGYHYHHGETESYFILTGHGTYDDNGEKQPANPGDLFLCKDGDAHGIKNTGDEELTFMALILKK